MKSIAKEYNLSEKLMVIIVYISLIYITFITPMMQLQMALFNNILVRGMHFQILLAVISIIYVVCYMIEGNKPRLTKFTISALLLGLYIIIDGIVIKFRLGYSYEYILFVYNNIFYLFMAFVVLIFPKKLSQKKLKNIFLTFGIIICVNVVLGLIQHIFNSPFYIYSEDVNGNSLFQSETFNLGGKVRAMGTTASGLKLGLLLIPAAAYSAYKLLYDFNALKKSKKVLHAISVIIIGITIFFTYTRNIYFILFYTLAFLLIYRLTAGKWRKLHIYLFPLIVPILYITAVLVLSFITSKNPTTSLFSAQSFLTRIIFWQDYMKDFFSWNLIDKLFGRFSIQIQGERAIKYNVPELVVDNMYINFLGFIGIVGVIVFIIFIWRLYLKIIKSAESNTLLLIFAIYLSSIFTMGILNVLEDIFLFIVIFISCVLLNTLDKEGRDFGED
ncbi:hypothetical protein [Clostridium polynesiense]|uniref:hypothetical protein n=1 Tax=Clostridium polynesiense TaxID=1325933 RepID=UPI00058CB7C4|nr:hypothetical protein [Clostridium polynesiense]